MGTAVVMLEKWPQKKVNLNKEAATAYSPQSEVYFRQWWGKTKRQELESSLVGTKPWQVLKPILPFGLKLVPLDVNEHYKEWPLVTELFPWQSPGINSSRDADLTHIDSDVLETKIKSYFDPKKSWKQIASITPSLCASTKRFNAENVRTHLLSRGIEAGRFIRFCYRPFEVRWLFWHPDTKLLDEKRVELVNVAVEGNLFFVSRPKAERTREGSPCAVTRNVSDRHLTRPGAMLFPLFYVEGTSTKDDAHSDLFASAKPTKRPNLSQLAKKHLQHLGLTIGEGINSDSELLFYHVIAIFHSPTYLRENEGALMQGWPRVPLPKDAATLKAGAALGRQLAALLDPETPVPGVTDLKVRENLKGLGELTVSKGKSPDLAIAARWGYAGQGGVTMPGPGKTTSGTRSEGFLDIHLNATTRWKDVPTPVWTYTLGGYQVLKKWLSYRESALLGRPLTSDEAQQFTHHVRRIASILALHGELDGHYQSSI